MLHVLLLILKMIGFLILGLLGLLLSLVLLVLLVPIRYRVAVSYDEKPKGAASVTWLLHICSVKVSYEEELQMAIKIFGCRLFKDKGEHAEDVLEDVAESVVEKSVKKTGDVLEHSIKKMEDPLLTGKIPETQKETSKERVPKTRGLLEKIKFIFKSIYAKLKNINDIWKKAQEFIQNVENQKLLNLILRQVKRLLRHIVPRKINGAVTFGFDDPYTTGQVLSAASILYAWYGDKIQITPVFDEQVLEGHLNLKGRIRIGTILWLVLRILMNKNFRVLLKKWQGKGGVTDGR